jgi:hypothetical protein
MEMLKSVVGAGSAAVITVTFIHPIDVLKTRLQVSGDASTGARNYKSLGIGGTISVIAKEEGVAAFWKGIGAAWMREASYTSLRLGLYSPIKAAMGVKKDSSFFMKFVAGGLAGALGSMVGNPFDVVKTRMMAAEGKTVPPMSKTFADLYAAQGLGGFYRGLQANVMRAVVLNGTKMACYDQIKSELVRSGVVKPKTVLADFVAAFGAGFFMTCTVAPFDKIRTRLMNQPPDAKIYSGFVDCLIKIVRAEGPAGLYAGFIPIWARFAPTTSMQLVIFGLIKNYFDIEGEGG